MSSRTMEIQVDSGWSKSAILFVIGSTVLFALFNRTYLELLDFWWNYSAYNHCILVVPIVCYLIYEKRAELLSHAPQLSWLGIGYLFANCLLWLIGSFLLISFFQHLAAIGFVVGLAWALIGNSRAWVIAFPLFYLYFGVPAGEALVPHLRDLTAEVVVGLLRLTGIPVFLEGRYLTIPSGQFHVAKACSGINYLIATLAVGSVFAYLRYRSPLRRTLFMGLAILVPLVANGLRAYGIVMIAHMSDYKYAVGIDHYIYGWVFFGVVIFILFAIGNSFSDDHAVDNIAYDFSRADSSSARNTSALTIFALCMSLLVATFYANSWFSSRSSINDTYSLPVNISWELTADKDIDLKPSYSGNPETLEGFYGNLSSDIQVKLQAAVYSDIEQHGELENLANIVYEEESWQRISGPDNVAVETNTENPVVEEYVLRRNGAEYLVWTWYDVSDMKLIGPRDVKLAITKARITGSYRGGAQITIATSLKSTNDEAREWLKTFLHDLDPSMSAFRTK